MKLSDRFAMFVGKCVITGAVFYIANKIVSPLTQNVVINVAWKDTPNVP